MTAQLILLGTRKPDSDQDFMEYASVAGPMFVAAGGEWNGQFDRVDDLADSGPDQVRIMNFPDEETIRGLFASEEYQKVVPARDRAFEELRIMIAAVPT